MITSIDVYDFEGNVPDIISPAFPVQMNVGTINRAPNLQRVRPRCDLMFRAISTATPPRVMSSPVFTAANLIPQGALYTRNPNDPPTYSVSGTVKGSMYFYVPGENEGQLVFIYPNFSTKVFTQAGFIVFDGSAVSLNANVVDGPVGPFPDLPVTAIFRPSAPGRAIGAYEGDLELDLITEPSTAGKSQHSAYRSAVRRTLELDSLRNAVNLTSSPYQIDFLYCTGASDTIKTDQGYEVSKMTYRIQFSIKQDAFNQLAAA